MMLQAKTWIVAIGSFVAGAGASAAYFLGLAPAPEVVQATKAYKEERFEAAANLAKLRLREVPADVEAIKLAARSLARLGRYEEAESYFAFLDSNESEDLHLRARGLARRGMFPRAGILYEQILEKWPDDAQAIQALASIRTQQGRDREALQLARRLIDIPSHQAVGYVLSGMIEYHLKRYLDAVASMKKGLELSPNLEGMPVNKLELLQWLADALIRIGNAPEAEKYAIEAERISSSVEMLTAIGMARRMQGDETGARQWFEKALAANPNFILALREMGQLYLGQQKAKEAVPYLEKALQLDPQDQAVRYSLITTYKKLGRNADADRLANK